MLNVSSRATHVIRGLLGKERPGAGLRLAPSQPVIAGSTLEINVAIAPQAAPTDQVVAMEGARVFVDEDLIAVLGDRTLDVQPSGGQAPTVFRLVRTR